LKASSIQELIAGIRAAAAGESLISPQIATKVLQLLRAQHTGAGRTKPVRAELSERELDVLKLIAVGKDNAEIAKELYISPKTVKNHISNILMKLQIDNRIQAAVYAVRSGIVWRRRALTRAGGAASAAALASYTVRRSAASERRRVRRSSSFR